MRTLDQALYPRVSPVYRHGAASVAPAQANAKSKGPPCRIVLVADLHCPGLRFRRSKSLHANVLAYCRGHPTHLAAHDTRVRNGSNVPAVTDSFKTVA